MLFFACLSQKMWLQIVSTHITKNMQASLFKSCHAANQSVFFLYSLLISIVIFSVVCFAGIKWLKNDDLLTI